MFVTTADPVREPPLIVVNTVLSLLAVNYPANKLACYVSDDGCSPLTYFSLKEASKFAKIWVPFCKKYNVRVRAPFMYFRNSPEAAEGSEFSKDWEMTKVKGLFVFYKFFKQCLSIIFLKIVVIDKNINKFFSQLTQ